MIQLNARVAAGSSSARVRSHFERLWPTQGEDGIDTLLAQIVAIENQRKEAERRAEEEVARKRAAQEKRARELEAAEEFKAEQERTKKARSTHADGKANEIHDGAVDRGSKEKQK